MRLKITIDFAALLLDALASVPAFARRSDDDGGTMVIVPNGERMCVNPKSGGTVTVSVAAIIMSARGRSTTQRHPCLIRRISPAYRAPSGR